LLQTIKSNLTQLYWREKEDFIKVSNVERLVNPEYDFANLLNIKFLAKVYSQESEEIMLKDNIEIHKGNLDKDDDEFSRVESIKSQE
jgi:hypothetical protein